MDLKLLRWSKLKEEVSTGRKRDQTRTTPSRPFFQTIRRLSVDPETISSSPIHLTQFTRSLCARKVCTWKVYHTKALIRTIPRPPPLPPPDHSPLGYKAPQSYSLHTPHPQQTNWHSSPSGCSQHWQTTKNNSPSNNGPALPELSQITVHENNILRGNEPNHHLLAAG